MRHTLIAAITVLMMMVGIVPGHAEKRVALVIGNSAYRNEPSLRNPANDAAAMVELFRSARFDVVEPRSNVGNAELRRAIRDFADSARDADMAVVFYSGHGIEVDGTNYLIPVDARLERDFDVEDETVSLDRVLKAIEPARMRIVILDACRDNPFQRTMKLTIQTRSIRRGLADVQLPMSGMLVAFAARAGTAAEDGDGRNSPFTAALLKNIATPGLDVRLAFGKVRDEVLEATAGRQEPFIYHSLGGQTVSLVAAPPPPTNEPAPVLSVTSEAAQAWAVTRDTTSQAVLEDFIRQFGTTVYGSMARARLEEFKKTQVAALALEQRKIEQQELARSLQRFDGTWLATKTCPRGDGALGFTWQFIADVKAGVFHGQHGAVGKPDSQTFDGKIQPDGAALISVVGLTGASASTPGRPPPGTPLSYIVNATFQDSTGRGTQLAPGRTCNFAFAKQGVPSAQPSVATLSVPKSTTTVFAPPRPTLSDVQRFDGLWIGKLDCEAKGDVQAYSYTFVGRVNDGVFHGERGVEGQPDWATFDGTIRRDGGITLIWKSLAGRNPAGTLNHLPPGSPGTSQAYGSFEGSRGSALRTEGRTCRFEFTKEEPTRAVEGRGGGYQPETQATPPAPAGPPTMAPTAAGPTRAVEERRGGNQPGTQATPRGASGPRSSKTKQ